MFFAPSNIVDTDTADSDSIRRNEAIQARKRAISLTEVGPNVYEMVKNLLAPNKPKDTPLGYIHLK